MLRSGGALWSIQKYLLRRNNNSRLGEGKELFKERGGVGGGRESFLPNRPEEGEITYKISTLSCDVIKKTGCKRKLGGG